MTSTIDLHNGGTVRPITRWGDPVMHVKTAPITSFDDELHDLIRDMFATMDAANGVGLAANQIGISRAVFVYAAPDADGKVRTGVFCNPVVTLPEGSARHLEQTEEGCLSLPGAFAPLSRPDQASCSGQDAFGNAITVSGDGTLARALQHETDHLNGTVFGDRLPTKVRRELFAEHDELAENYPADWPVSPMKDDS